MRDNNLYLSLVSTGLIRIDPNTYGSLLLEVSSYEDKLVLVFKHADVTYDKPYFLSVNRRLLHRIFPDFALVPRAAGDSDSLRTIQFVAFEQNDGSWKASLQRTEETYRTLRSRASEAKDLNAEFLA